jgi:hypothetical protein
VVTALVESTSKKVLHSALLISNHADMLCELVQVVNIEEVIVVPEEATEPEQTSINPVESEDSKRRKSVSPPPRAIKKATRPYVTPIPSDSTRRNSGRRGRRL